MLRSPAVRQVILLGPSLVLAVLMIFHPSPYDDVAGELVPIAGWWTFLHTAQFFLFAFVGASVWLLVDGLRGTAAVIARVAAVVFVLFYDIGDAVAGIATGILAGKAAGGAVPEDAAVMAIAAIFTDLTKDVFFGIGILAWIAALGASAVALWRAGTPRPPVAFLLLPALLLTFDHAFPYGALTFASYFLVILWLELSQRRGPGRTRASVSSFARNERAG
ncbi:MAG TPA: hypothetical protein VJ827_05345 [Rubrobacter sp.]|nr:hypothetical protein [Rubrobacter sp.]